MSNFTRQNAAFPLHPEAHPTLYISERPFLQGKGWGGKRNAARRVSHSIKLQTALRIVEAAQRAGDLGLPFNRHLTIHWEKNGIKDERAAWATGRYLKMMGDWVRKRGGQFAYVWVRENGETKGTHVHILFHLPRGWHLGSMTRRWLSTLTGQPPRGMGKTVVIARCSGAAFTGSDWYVANLANLTGYVLKGVSRDVGEALGLDRYGMGGHITGKRVSISQNLRA